MRLRDQSILESLLSVSDGRGLSGNALHLSWATSDRVDEVFKLFLFMSDHSRFEWAVHRKGSSYTIGTARSETSSSSAASFGVYNPDASVHSHPGAKYIDQTEAIKSMGYDEINPMGDWENVLKIYYETNIAKSNNYVYFPASKKLYHVGVYFPSYIRTILSYKDFYFGTLNHK